MWYRLVNVSKVAEIGDVGVFMDRILKLFNQIKIDEEKYNLNVSFHIDSIKKDILKLGNITSNRIFSFYIALEISRVYEKLMGKFTWIKYYRHVIPSIK